jgi:hypothetical protein
VVASPGTIPDRRVLNKGIFAISGSSALETTQ